MLKANLIVSLRSLKKHLVYTWVNVLGLSLALCCVFLTYFYTTHEWTYDQSYPDSERIYRVVLENYRAPDTRTSAISVMHTHEFDKKFPGVEALAVTLSAYNEELVRAKKRYELAFDEKRLIYADEHFLSIFAPKMIQGDVNLFNLPRKVLLSQKAAAKYFGDEKATGETLVVGRSEFEVIGVFEDFPTNSSIRPDFLVSMKTKQVDDPHMFQTDGYFLFHTYIKVASGTDIGQLQEDMRVDAVSRDIMGREMGSYVLDPLEDYHFQTVDFISTMAPKADEKLIYWLMGISIGLLLVAIANFGNISLAVALSKTKEIAVRKIVGARKIQIIKRSLFESLLLSSIAFLMAIVLMELSLPMFSDFVDRELSHETISLSSFAVIFAIAIGVGIISGIYPALLISNFNVMSLFKNESKEKRSNFSFRNLLLSFQFVITFVMLTLTLVMNRQINFLLEKDPGFDYENVVVFTPAWYGQEMMSKVQAFKEELLAMPEVADITLSDISPMATLRESDMRRKFVKGESAAQYMLVGGVDCHYFDFYEMKTNLPRDITNQFCEPSQIVVLNPEAKALYDKEMTGRSMVHYAGEIIYPVIQEGHINDFYITSTKEPFIPMAFMPLELADNRFKYSIKLKESANQAAFIAQLNEMWWDINPYEPFDLKVLEDEHQRIYSSEIKLKAMASVLSLVVCIIAFAGVFALSIFYGKQKLKEIGIRKVLGANFRNLFMLQSRTFFIILLVSCAAAIPLVQWLANDWMQQFASRVEPSNWIYPIAAVMLVVCTVFSAGWYSAKVARVNPAEIMRDL